jgi:hypothetical protein
MLNNPIRPGDETNLSLILGRSITYVLNNAVHLNNISGVTPTPNNINSPRTPLDVLGDLNTPRDKVLHVRSDIFYILKYPSDEVSE